VKKNHCRTAQGGAVRVSVGCIQLPGELQDICLGLASGPCANQLQLSPFNRSIEHPGRECVCIAPCGDKQHTRRHYCLPTRMPVASFCCAILALSIDGCPESVIRLTDKTFDTKVSFSNEMQVHVPRFIASA